MRSEDSLSGNGLLGQYLDRTGRAPRARTPPDVFNAILAPIDQSQQISHLTNFSSTPELGPGVDDLFEQGVDLPLIAFAPDGPDS